MKRALIGYTGFVGSNLHAQIQFDDVYNSKNIQLIANKTYDEVFCAGVRAQKWIANAQPEADLKHIKSLIHHLESAKIKRMVLISTIDVYPVPVEVNEQAVIDESQQSAYGRNRYFLEKWVMTHFQDYLIIRLPGLFGRNLKKNFIYDMIHPLPSLLNQKVMDMLLTQMREEHQTMVLEHYHPKGLDFLYDGIKHDQLKAVFAQYDFSSLTFTDSQDSFQYYDLSRLSEDIDLCKHHEIKIINFATEPVTAKEVYHHIYHRDFSNTLERNKQFYNFHTRHAACFGSGTNYIMNKTEVLARIQQFLQEALV